MNNMMELAGVLRVLDDCAQLMEVHQALDERIAAARATIAAMIERTEQPVMYQLRDWRGDWDECDKQTYNQYVAAHARHQSWGPAPVRALYAHPSGLVPARAAE